MRRILNSVIIAAALSLLILLPTEELGTPLPVAHATPSGASSAFPPNHNFEAGISQVGGEPTNYDFSNGDEGWTKTGTGSATYSGGGVTLSGSVVITSTLYTSASTTQGIKIRYRYPGSSSAQIAVYTSGGSGVGTDNLSCSNCATGEWTDKYLGIYPSALGQSVRIKIVQTSGTTEVDEFGTQWVTLREWRGTSSGIKSQPKSDGDWFAEVRGTLFTGNFHLTENRIEFDYAFPPSGNQLTVNLYRASDNLILTSTIISGSGVGWTRKVWTWGASDYTGQAVYIKFFSTDSQPTWIDNVGANLLDATSREDHPSEDAGEPFDTSTGQFIHSNTDLVIPARGIPLEFTRTYFSMGATPGDLGYNWRHTYSLFLRIDTDNSVTVYYPSGGASYFKYNSGSYTPPASVYDTLVKNGDATYTLTTVGRIRYNFSSAGKLTNIVDRNNNTTTISYDGNGYLSQVQDAGGRTLTFTVVNGRITQVQDPLSRTMGFQYDASGDLVQVTDVKSGTTTYTYSNHRMTSLTDSNNHLQNQNTYDGAGRIVEQTDATGGKTCAYYGTAPSYTSAACTGVTPAPAAGQTVVVDPRGNKTTFDFDTKFRTTTHNDHQGASTTYIYDSNNNPTCVTDQRSNKTAYGYDSAGNVTEIIDALNTDANCQLKAGGMKWTTSYTANNDVDLETDTLGRQLDYIYDSPGNLTRIVRKDASGVVKALTCFEVNALGQLIAEVQSTDLIVPPSPTDPCSGQRTQFGYDSNGNRTCIVNPRFSSPTLSCSQIATKTTFIFDNAGRMLSTTSVLRQPNGAAESGSQCGAAGTGNGVDDDADTVIDDGCPSAIYTYDNLNQELTGTNGLGYTTSTTYDNKGDLLTETYPNRQPNGAAESGSQCGAAWTGNGVDDDADTVIDDGCPSAIYTYDYADRPTRTVDALGQSTTYAYDEVGNLTSVTNPKRQPVGSSEAANQCGAAGTGNGVDDDADTVIDDGCPSAIYVHDSIDRLQSTIDALGRTTSYSYDAASNLTQRTDARGLVTKYFPDAIDRTDLVEHWSGAVLVDSIDYSYDEVGNKKTMTDQTGTTTYNYDALNRVTSIVFPGPKTVGYQYDDLPGGSAADYPGQRTKITYPDGKIVSYTYLSDGRMSSVTDWQGKLTSYTYDNAGRLANTQYPNTVWTDFTYDAAARLTSVANRKPGPVTISSFTYSMDAAGNRTQMVDSSGTHTHQYDPLYRLTQASYPGGASDTYTFDSNGNRLSKNATSHTYDAADQMLTAGTISYGYDANGNQTSRATDIFTYDHENQLTQSVINGVVSSSTYNGDGLRMNLTVAGQPTNYTWDVTIRLPVVIQDGTNSYVYGLDLISATDGSGAQTYFTYDGLGSTTDLADSFGNVVATYSYDVFGAVRSQTGSSPNYWLFRGEQKDSSGFFYLRARYYDPDAGRFLTQDPLLANIAAPQGENRYPYAANDPVNLADPTGLSSIPDKESGTKDPPQQTQPKTDCVMEIKTARSISQSRISVKFTWKFEVRCNSKAHAALMVTALVPVGRGLKPGLPEFASVKPCYGLRGLKCSEGATTALNKNYFYNTTMCLVSLLEEVVFEPPCAGWFFQIDADGGYHYGWGGFIPMNLPF